MANAGAFKKGEKRPKQGRPKGSTNKTTADVREAIALLAETQVPRLTEWLDRVAESDPGKAAEILLKAIEYHVPKLARTEITGKDGGPVVVAADELDQRL